MKVNRAHKIAFALIFLFLIFSNLSCGENIKLPSVDKSFSSENGNFVLYVSNQSFKISKVYIQIKIDSKVVVSQFFKVGNQHNWKGFQFSLSKGIHTLEARSDQEDVEFAQEFEITDKHWAVVDFWYYPKTHGEPAEGQFTFNIRNEPILFD